MYHVGRFYEEGLAVSQDLQQALHYYELAGQNGIADGYIEIGRMYEDGLLKQSYAQALMYYQKALDMDSPRASYFLGNMYKAGKGVEQDFQKAIAFFKQGANRNHPSSLYNLAVLYDFEAGEKWQDKDKAILYYQKAVDQGHPGAMNNLGVCYKEGDGVAVDLEKSFALFLQAAKLDNENAYLNLARAYTYGQGTKVSIKDAKYWCQKALDAQVDGAKELMKVIKRKSFVHPFKNS